MLTGFRVSSLTIRCVFYRPEHKANEGPLEWKFLKKMGLKCLKNGKNLGAVALSYPFFY